MDELIDLLDLEEIEVNLFRARQPDTLLQRVFGGQVLAQALIAAARTVPVTRVVHSLHAYFLLPGRIDLPIVYDVEAVRDGGSFSSRRVVARQGGKVIFYLSSSFHEVEDGFEHLEPMPEGVPSPDECPKLGDVLAKVSGRSPALWEREWGVLDLRYVGDSRPGGSMSDDAHPARARVWVRADGVLPDDRRLHQAALAYASDLTLLSPAPCRTTCSSDSTSRPPPWTTPCGSTAPSAPTTGCSTTRSPRPRPTASPSPPPASSRTASWCRTSPKKGCCAERSDARAASRRLRVGAHAASAQRSASIETARARRVGP